VCLACVFRTYNQYNQHVTITFTTRLHSSQAGERMGLLEGIRSRCRESGTVQLGSRYQIGIGRANHRSPLPCHWASGSASSGSRLAPCLPREDAGVGLHRCPDDGTRLHRVPSRPLRQCGHLMPNPTHRHCGFHSFPARPPDLRHRTWVT